jgi:hypothetical protein
MNPTMKRTVCSLPKALRTLCESGCIYRERNFKHLQCPVNAKVATCVAPCSPPCACKVSQKTQNEVRQLQTAHCG